MKYTLTLFTLFFVFNLNAQISDQLEMLDIFNLEYVSDPQISPNGSQIIYVRNFKDVMTDRNLSNLWIINFDGTNHRPLTTGSQNDFSPRWSNDGKKIAYKSNKAGSTQIYVLWLDNRDEAKISNTVNSPGSFSWSPDDKFLAFTMNVPFDHPSIIKLPAKPKGAVWNDPPKYIDRIDYRRDGRGYAKDEYSQIFILSVDGGTPRQLTDGPYNYSMPTWANDNTQLIFSANLRKDAAYQPANSELYTLNIASGKIDTLTQRKGPDGNPKLNAQGNKIAYLGYDDEFKGYQINKLYVCNLDGSDSKLISGSFDRNIEDMAWLADGKSLLLQYTDHGKTKLAKLTLSGKINDVTSNLGGLSLGRPYNAASFTLAGNGNYAYTHGTTQYPSELGIGNNGNDKRLTFLNQDLFQYKKLGQVEEITFASSHDQKEIQGWIVKPPNFDPAKKYPFILEIHGGPFASYGAVFSAEIQLFAAAGYVVLYTNPRGSAGYGYDFGNEIDHDYPSHDYDDLMSGVDAVIAKGYIDESKLFVTGGSGGGVLSAWIVGKTNRFAAAVVAKPVINWYSWALYADLPVLATQYWFEGFPWENPEAYMSHSPISLVGNVETPTMLLTGEADYRTPIFESEQFYAALKLRKIETSLVRIPGASHGIAARPSNLMAKVASILAWFEKYNQ